MNDSINSSPKGNFVSVGFLYNPLTKNILLHHRDSNAPTNPNKWGLFGGKGENDESPVEAFIREIKEELTIDIVSTNIHPLYEYFDESTQHQRFVFYVESQLEKEQMTLGEGQGFDWIHEEKVFEYDLHARAKKDLETFLRIKK